MDQNSKLEQLRALLDTLSSCCADKATEAKLEQCRLLLNDILNAIPSAGSGNYALETSMQTSLTRLQSILDRITSVEADLGYDALLDPLDTQKKSLDDVQDKLQDILDAMPDIASLMTDAKGEAIHSLLQSIYNNCCPNTRLAEIRDRVALETTLQSILGSLPSTSGLALDATLQALLTCCNQRGTEATLQAIQGTIPSTSGLALDATLEQVRINTSHLDQMESSISIIRSTVEAIRACACRSYEHRLYVECNCEEGVERNLDDPESTDWGVDDPGVDPPTGDPDWNTWRIGKCRLSRHFVYRFIRHLDTIQERWEDVGELALDLLDLFISIRSVSAVGGAPVAVARGIKLAKTGVTVATGGTAIVALVVMEAISLALRAAFALGSALYDGMRIALDNARCDLVRAIYCGHTGQQIKDNWDAVIDEYIDNPLWPLWKIALKLMLPLDTANVLSAGQWQDELEEVLTWCACDCMGDWHDPDLMLHTHDSLRDMVLSGSDVVEWNNTGALGGKFIASGSPQYTGGAVVIAPNKKLSFSPDESHDGRYDALYIVLQVPGTDSNARVLYQDGQDSDKPHIRAYGPGSLQLELRGKDWVQFIAPVGRVVLGMREDPGDRRTYYTLNGAAVGDAAPSWSPGCFPPLYLGSPAASDSANAQIWAVVGYKNTNTLTAAQETDIVNNLMSLYPV
jgi:hypothetical protein